ncbi:hypothetical protein DXG01_001346 [Tephrocybe rancida]|nr:hypothetical protein DXG01_001346 [Tephrocybe rancida]
MDGGLERLVRILHDFCLCPPPPENGAVLYGLIPPSSRPPKPLPTLNPATFDKQAAYRFSLAFQCVVNIGVRGSEPIRSRVVQAGTLDVVGCILEAWLANKGFATGPSSSATGMPRETKEQRQARRDAHVAARVREQNAELERQRNRMPVMQRGVRQGTVRLPGEDDTIDPRAPRPSTRRAQREADAGPSTIRLQSDDRQLTLRAQDERDRRDMELARGPRPSTLRLPGQFEEDDTMSMSISIDPSVSPAPSTSSSSSTIHDALLLLSASASTPSGSDTEMSEASEMSSAPTPLGSGTPTGSVIFPSRDRSGTIIARPVWDNAPHQGRRASPASPASSSRPDTETEDEDVDMSGEHHHAHQHQHQQHRRAVGIVSDDPPADTHIIISEGGGLAGGVGVGVEDGIVSLEANDDFAMGAPPGAPGAIGIAIGMGMEESEDEGGRADVRRGGGGGMGSGGVAPDATPRPGVVGLPAERNRDRDRDTTQPPVPAPAPQPAPQPQEAGTAQGQGGHRHRHHHGHHHHHAQDAGPYRDEDVLLSLQLLAYLSKYPHVRQAFYRPRATFHPASVDVVGGRWGNNRRAVAGKDREGGAGSGGKEKEKEKEKEREKEPTTTTTTTTAGGFFRSFGRAKDPAKEKDPAPAPVPKPTPAPPRQTNVFSLVERFTFKPSSTETELPNPPPRLPPEIQYWAGVVMRNACRKDEGRGGIRQKAKYCGKECQSTAWSEGHRFWCSAKDDDDVNAAAAAEAAVGAGMAGAGAGGDVRRERGERRRERGERGDRGDREREGTQHAHTLRGPGSTGTVRGDPPVYPADAQRTVRAAANTTRAVPGERTAYFHATPSNHTQAQQQDPIGTPAAGMSRGARVQGFVPPYETYTEASAGGRRRAETVTGATLVGGVGSGVGGVGTPSITHHLHGPGHHGHGQRLAPPRAFAVGAGAAANPLLQLAPSPTTMRGEPSTSMSRWRGREGEGFGSPVEEDDMVLG